MNLDKSSIKLEKSSVKVENSSVNVESPLILIKIKRLHVLFGGTLQQQLQDLVLWGTEGRMCCGSVHGSCLEVKAHSSKLKFKI